VARRTPLTTLRQISEINLTPLMDLTFILLITFIITFPLIEQGILVNLPKADAEHLEPDQARTISVDGKGRVFYDNRPVSLDELKTKMKELAAAASGVTVMVRADEAIAYGRVVEILKILHQAKIVKMALVTEAENG